MTNLVLTEEQTKLLAWADGPVAIITTAGDTIAVVRGFTQEEVLEAEKKLVIEFSSWCVMLIDLSRYLR